MHQSVSVLLILFNDLFNYKCISVIYFSSPISMFCYVFFFPRDILASNYNHKPEHSNIFDNYFLQLWQSCVISE